jgi:hypothetical protein
MKVEIIIKVVKIGLFLFSCSCSAVKGKLSQFCGETDLSLITLQPLISHVRTQLGKKTVPVYID